MEADAGIPLCGTCYMIPYYVVELWNYNYNGDILKIITIICNSIILKLYTFILYFMFKIKCL